MILETMTYGFVGLGLMGTSLARAIRQNVLSSNKNCGKIYACDVNKESLENALQTGTIDCGFDIDDVAKMLADCDLVYICLYPKATLHFLQQNAIYFKENSIITDISGTKTFIMNDLPNITQAQFIAGHPMAGNEKEGYKGANAQMFHNRNYILMPSLNCDKEKLKLLQDLIYRLGFKAIITTDTKTHDHKIAFTSQLCHVIASSLVMAAEDENITEFGGGSFEDLTRIAMINAPLWTELFLENKEELLWCIDNFQASIAKLKDMIKNNDKKGLEQALQEVRERRIRMAQIK